MNTKITLAKGGTKERTVDIRDVHIPDLWHVAMRVMEAGELHDSPCREDDHEMILEVWHIAHDLLRHLQDEAGFDQMEVVRRRFTREAKKVARTTRRKKAAK